MSYFMMLLIISFVIFSINGNEYNLIDTNPECYDLGLCFYGYPGSNNSIHPNSEERTQHIFHNIARSFPFLFIDSKYGKYRFGTWGDKTYINDNCIKNITNNNNNDNNNSNILTTWYDPKLNQMARFKQFDDFYCNETINTHYTCSSNCDLFKNNDCSFIDRCLSFLNDTYSCNYLPELEGIWGANVGYGDKIQCLPIFNKNILFQGVGFWPKMNRAATNYLIINNNNNNNNDDDDNMDNFDIPYPIPMG